MVGWPVYILAQLIEAKRARTRPETIATAKNIVSGHLIGELKKDVSSISQLRGWNRIL